MPVMSVAILALVITRVAIDIVQNVRAINEKIG
jgi:hypothetical protein